METPIPTFARELTALLVEDDAATRTLMAAQLKGVFKELVLAADGREGLAAFQAHHPQLVLTDNGMPGLSGIEMTEAIRLTDPKVPVIFFTSYMDTALLVRAINLGIAAFIPKPATMDSLRKAVAMVAGMLEHDHLQRRNLEQDLALLQFRERYHEHQQELAFRKELSILENDFAGRSFSSPGGEWIAQVEYRPHDIMCGDSYSLRRIGGGMLVFLADAMGKGLAASLSTSLSVHTFNLLADVSARGSFVFRTFVRRYTAMMRKRLLEDEVLPLTLAWLPEDRPVMELAAFGMPPILLGDAGPVRKVRCDNPPLSAYIDTFRTTVHELGATRSVLFYTDGLNEAATADGSLYREHLDRDFTAGLGRGQLWRAFQGKVGAPADDVALVLLTRVDGEPLWEAGFTFPSRLAEVERAGEDLEARLEDCPDLPADQRGEFAMAIREALLNAYEHGSLEIDFAAKARMLEQGTYYQTLREREATVERPIEVRMAVLARAGQRLLKVTIQDAGPGFAPAPFLFQGTDTMLASGRGLRMVRACTDAFYLNEKGNAITLIRICPGGNHAIGPNQRH